MIRTIGCLEGDPGGVLLPSDSKKCCSDYISCAKCQGTQGEFLLSIFQFWYIKNIMKSLVFGFHGFFVCMLRYIITLSASVGKCPSSHPFLLNHGRSCCSSDSVYHRSGCKTHYKNIQPKLPPECCKEKNRIECAGMMCQTNTKAISENIFFLDRNFFDMFVFKIQLALCGVHFLMIMDASAALDTNAQPDARNRETCK